MGYQLTEWAVREAKGLKLNERAVLAYICTYIGEQGVAYPSMDRIAIDLEVDTKTARRIVHQLRDRGLIDMEEIPGHPSRIRVSHSCPTPPKDVPGPLPGLGGTPPKDVPQPLPRMGAEPVREPVIEPVREPSLSAGRGRGTRRAIPKSQYGEHLERAKALCERVGLPRWKTFDEGRAQLLVKRMRSEGISDLGEFWDRADEVVGRYTPEYSEGWRAGTCTLEVLLRVPGQGNPDHWRKLEELPEVRRVDQGRLKDEIAALKAKRSEIEGRYLVSDEANRELRAIRLRLEEIEPRLQAEVDRGY